MKNCVDCSKELPDTAVHCVFCGAKQPAAGGGSQAKTIMGYAAADLLKELDKKGAAPGTAPQQPAPQQPAPQQQPDPASGPNTAEARTVFGAEAASIAGHPFGPGASSGPPPAQGGPPPAQGGPPPAQGGPPPAQGGPPPAQQGYGAPPPQQGYGAPPPQQGGGHGGPPPAQQGYGAPPPQQGGGYGAPPPAQQGYGAPPAQQGYGGAPAAPMHDHGSGPAPHPGGYGSAPHQQAPAHGSGPALHPGYGAPQHQGGAPAGYAPRPVGHGHPSTEQVRPLQAPPYLASQTAARMGAPQEPWAESLKLIMLVFGVLLIAAFAAPWSAAGDTQFSWDFIKDAPGKLKVFPLLIAGTGLLAVVLALIPLATIQRGLGAAVLGLLPPLYFAVVFTGEFQWRALVGILGLLTLVPGLLVRNEYTGAMAGRILVTIGVACMLAVSLIPEGGQVPLVNDFKAIGDAPGKYKVQSVIELLPFIVALLSLLVWLPGPSTAGAKILAWFFILWMILESLSGLAFLPEGAKIGDVIKGSLNQLIWIPLSFTAWLALVGYGGATVIGKQLEHA